MPDWSEPLRNLYWKLRYRRVFDNAVRVKMYREIQKEKRRLCEEVGVDQEEVRLLCRHLANPSNRHSEMRWLAYSKQLKLAF